MNKLMIIGNLTRDPERRTLQDGTPLCVFTVAVNRRRAGNGDKDQVDYFRVTAWNGTGDACAKYLTKGRKVCVTGPVSANAYAGQDGQARASLEVNAQEVEFLSSHLEGSGESSSGYGSGAQNGYGYSASNRASASGENGYAAASPHQEAMNLSSASDYMEVEPDDLPF